jgi:predicted metal-dependent peptidase
MLPEIITRARARLLVRAPFFGSIALGLRWVAEPAIRTMATDGRAIWFHAAWCEAQGVDKAMGVVAHEVLHVVNKHHLRRRDRDARLWNVACDLFINRILLADNWPLPDTLLFDRDGRFAGLPAEVIYERLLDERQQEGDRRNEEPSGGDAPSRASTKTQDDGGQDQNDRREGQGIKPAENWGEVRDLTAGDGATLTESARRRAEDDLDMRIRQAVAAAKRAGRFGGALHEVVEAALDRVDWRDRLRTMFDGTMRGEASWARPNRRFLPHGLYLPGWKRAGAGRVAFVLDTSGSISARELGIYAANLLGIIKETGPEQIALVQCDTAVKHVAYLGPGESAERIEVVGRGGTLFQPAFDWIAASGFAPNVIVYATDLRSADCPADPGCPVIWLTPTRSKSMPFGEIVEVMP